MRDEEKKNGLSNGETTDAAKERDYARGFHEAPGDESGVRFGEGDGFTRAG